MVPRKATKRESRVEEVESRNYELVVIISPEVEGEKLDTVIDNIGQFITGKGGVVSGVDRWGRRKLAYPIKHFMEGNYVLAQFSLVPTLSKELEAKLHISEEILRHLLIKVN